VTACPSWEKIKQGSKSEKTNPFKSLRPEGGKMLTYLEAMRRPKKHMVNTFAIGITAILMVPSTDPPPAATGISMESAKAARIRAIILRILRVDLG
jgi:hypothetical protein